MVILSARSFLFYLPKGVNGHVRLVTCLLSCFLLFPTLELVYLTEKTVFPGPGERGIWMLARGHMTERNYRTRGLAYGEDIHTLIFREVCA